MTHGLPDYYDYGSGTTVHAIRDMSELAVRLGSINYFDRRGEVVFMDDFEDTTLKWETTSSGTGGAVALDSAEARSGNSSLKLTAPTGAGKFINAIKYMPFVNPGKHGFEASFLASLNVDYILFYMDIYDGTDNWKSYVRYVLSTTKLQVASPGVAGWNDVATVPLFQGYSLFHTIKTVVDTLTGNYVRVILNDVEYDISSYSMPTTSSGTVTQLRTGIALYSDGTASQVWYIDDVIVTQNEP